MRLAKLAVASVSPTVGAVRSNVDRLIAVAREMAEADVTIGAFPEQAVGGYPPEDLVQWRGLPRSASAPSSSASPGRPANATTVFVIGLAVSVGGQIFNAAAVVHRGRIAGIVPKEKLPTYNVFYEARTFSRGGPGLALDAAGVPLGDYRLRASTSATVAVEVCEDAWSPDGPMRRRCYSGAEIVVNVSASPYRMGVDSTRREMLATRAADNQALLLYANAVGGQDGLIFDGGGFIFQNGRLVLEAPRFARRLVVRAWSISIARGACGWRTPPGAPTARRSGCSSRSCRSFAVDGPTADRLDARLSRSRRRQLLPARAAGGARKSIRASARSTTCSRRSRSA